LQTAYKGKWPESIHSELAMAPLAPFVADGMVDIRLERRALGDSHNLTTHPVITIEQGNILQILALVFSAVSVASSGLAFYWFIKMRRSFRHE
jgi:G protein-coupled receptor GPR1